MSILIREATEEDLEVIFDIEKRSYPPELQATHEVLRNRFKIFGIRVAELDNEVVGFYTCVPILLDWSDDLKIIRSIKQNRNPYYKKWFDEYKKGDGFNTLYVASTAVSSAYQGKGIGKRLIEHSLGLARDNNLKYRCSVLRIPGFRKFQRGGMGVDEYLAKVKSGEIANRMLSLYLSLGFTLGQPIENYEPDRTSANYGVFAFKRF